MTRITTSLALLHLVVLSGGCASTEPDGPVEWILQALASEGQCNTDSDCTVFANECLPMEVREHSSCAVAVPTAFDTTHLEEVMDDIRETGLSPFEGGCGMCTLELAPAPVCLMQECVFPPSE